MEHYLIFWVGIFVRDERVTKVFKLEFRSDSPGEAAETVSNYIDRLETDGWYKKKDRMRMLREVSRG